MTRTQVLALTAPLFAVAAMGVPGCGGGDNTSQMSTIPAGRQSELDKQQQASDAYSNQEAKNDKQPPNKR